MGNRLVDVGNRVVDALAPPAFCAGGFLCRYCHTILVIRRDDKAATKRSPSPALLIRPLTKLCGM
jgi:hypothetical protein